jgi:circadian clock protein KaiC
MKLAMIDQFQPRVVVLDPISSYDTAGPSLDARAMLMRLIDHLKSRNITALLTSVMEGRQRAGDGGSGLLSLIDTWLVMRNLEQSGVRVRTLFIAKSRGMSHTSQAREFVLSSRGADLAQVFVAPDGSVLTASARAAQELADRAATVGIDIARLEPTASTRADGGWHGRGDEAATVGRQRSTPRTSHTRQ